MGKKEVVDTLKETSDKYGDNNGKFTFIDGVINLLKIVLFVFGKKK